MGSTFGAIWEDPEGGFIKFTVKRASKQDQTLYMEGKLHIILYFRKEWALQQVVILMILSTTELDKSGPAADIWLIRSPFRQSLKS